MHHQSKHLTKSINQRKKCQKHRFDLLSYSVVKEIFQKTPKMSTYLVAFIVSEFDCRRTKGDLFSVCARPRAYNQTEYSFDVGQKILAKYDEIFDYSYKTHMPKMTMAAIPDFSVCHFSQFKFPIVLFLSLEMLNLIVFF